MEMVKAIVRGLLTGIVILIAWYSIRHVGQPHTPTVFYPYGHGRDFYPAVHHIRWFPRRYGH
jgi:hypothetical protein